MNALQQEWDQMSWADRKRLRHDQLVKFEEPSIGSYADRIGNKLLGCSSEESPSDFAKVEEQLVQEVPRKGNQTRGVRAFGCTREAYLRTCIYRDTGLAVGRCETGPFQHV